MTRRAMGATILLASGAVALGLAIAGAAEAPSNPAKGATKKVTAEDLATTILARTDAIEELEGELIDGRAEAERLVKEYQSLEQEFTISKQEYKQFSEEYCDAQRRAMLASLRAAEADEKKAKGRRDWAEKATREKVLPELEGVAYFSNHRRAYASLLEAQTRRDTFEKETVPAETARLKANVLNAEENLARRRLDLARSQSRQAALGRKLEALALSEAEQSALARLDEAIQLREGLKPAEADAKLAEAHRLWSAEEARREERRRAALATRVRLAAAAARARVAEKVDPKVGKN